MIVDMLPGKWRVSQFYFNEQAICFWRKVIERYTEDNYIETTRIYSNYIKWFKWLQIFDTDKEIVKAKNFMVQSNVTHSYIKVKDLKNREPMYV
jgi:hypothetical protein